MDAVIVAGNIADFRDNTAAGRVEPGYQFSVPVE